MAIKERWFTSSLKKADVRKWGKLEIRILNKNDPSSRIFTVTHVHLPKGQILPAICHRRTKEWSYVLQGTLIATLNGKKKKYGPGDSIYMTPGVWHEFEAGTDVSALTMYMPPLVWDKPDVIAKKKGAQTKTASV
jgi:quercetin dioxygenase-like cupin family protein